VVREELQPGSLEEEGCGGGEKSDHSLSGTMMLTLRANGQHVQTCAELGVIKAGGNIFIKNILSGRWCQEPLTWLIPD
jgi:hypothetical protein